jgi:hypothetical protein
MRLNKSQKELVLQWIAEGIKPGEMNKRAAAEHPPFKVNRQQVEYYRRTRNHAIAEITEQSEFQALNTGFALREVRVESLKKLAQMMLDELLGGELWLTRLKSYGGGKYLTTFTEEEFNKGEVDAFRGVLDDIARELGHRAARSEISADPTGEIHVTFHNPYHTGEEDE